MGYRPIYWKSPVHYVAANETHIKDFWLEKPTFKTRVIAAWHKLLRKRDPFFYRGDYF